MRKAALRALPLLVVAWAFFAIMGGSLHAAGQGGADGEVVESALGVCAATVATLSVAALARGGPTRLGAFALERKLPPHTAVPNSPLPRAYSEPLPPAPPATILLKVIRA